MRKIGSLTTVTDAQQFRWYLFQQGIECHETDAALDIWVLSEDQVPAARRALEQFQANTLPDLAKGAGEGKKQLDRHLQNLASQLQKQRKAARSHSASGSNVTLMFVVICSVLFCMQLFDKGRSITALFVYSQDHLSARLGLHNFPEIASGQVWRLFTPVLLHGDFFHILFNMVWLFQIGGAIERAIGVGRYLTLIFAISIISNTAYYLVAGPAFLGSSGLVYGFVAYLAVMSKYQTNTSLHIDESTVKFFLIFYVFCWVLTVFHLGVANTIHGVGALVGMAVAYIHSGHWRTLRRRHLRITKPVLYNIAIGLFLLVGAIVTDKLTY